MPQAGCPRSQQSRGMKSCVPTFGTEMERTTHGAAPGSAEITAVDALTLVDWRRSIFELYGEVRASADAETAWRSWRDERERLMRIDPQSPVSEPRRGEFRGCRYFEYDPAARVLAKVSAEAPEHREIVTSTGVSYSFTRFGEATFELYGVACSLALYWLDGYGGGVFVPFGDGTSGESAPRRPLSPRHREGRRPRLVRSQPRLRLQLRLQPVLRLRPRWVCRSHRPRTGSRSA